MAQKKKEFLNRKSQLTESSNSLDNVEEVVKDSSTTEVEEDPYGNSFGQSAGLKDDLDVEDDGIGMLLIY